MGRKNVDEKQEGMTDERRLVSREELDQLTNWLIEDITAERATRGGNVESRESFRFVAMRLLTRPEFAALPQPATAHVHRAEYPSKCEGCEHVAADLVSRAPSWMLERLPQTATEPALDEQHGTICECGLAKSYHGPPTHLADHEYRPRYPQPATEPALPMVVGASIAEAIRRVSNRDVWRNTYIDWTALGAALVAEWPSYAAQPSAEVERLRAALEGVIAAIEDHTSPDGLCPWNRWEHDAVGIARAALAGSDRPQYFKVPNLGDTEMKPK